MNKTTDDNNTGNSVASMPLVQLVFIMVFGSTFVVAILIIALFVSHPTDFQYGVFRTVLAMAAAGVAVFIPGMLQLTLERKQLFALRAGGAIAVFAVVYFFDPAHWLITVNARNHAQVQTNREGTNVIHNAPLLVAPTSTDKVK